MKGHFWEAVLLGLRSEGGVNVEMSQEKREVLQKWHEIAFDFNFPTCNLWLRSFSVSNSKNISSKNNPKFSVLLLNIPSLKSILFSNNDS